MTRKSSRPNRSTVAATHDSIDASSNAHLDANLVDPSLSSFVWQAVLPFAGVDRRGYTDLVLDALGVDRSTVLFALLWLPEDTGETLD